MKKEIYNILLKYIERYGRAEAFKVFFELVEEIKQQYLENGGKL